MTGPMLEADLRRAILCDRKGYIDELTAELVTDCPGDCLAHVLGYRGMYATPLRTKRVWATPTRGDLGAGWPDLTLIRARRGRERLIFAELKAGAGKPTDAQTAVLELMRGAGLEAYLWSDTAFDDGRVYEVMQADTRREPAAVEAELAGMSPTFAQVYASKLGRDER